MINTMKSMTGYGRSKTVNEGREYSVEIKSVNHKYNDITIKIPKSISYLEDKVKNLISKNITRGKIDVFITFYNYSDKGKNIKINREIAKMYIQELRQLAIENDLKQEIYTTEITKFPEVLTVENIEDEELIWNELSKSVQEALNNFITMRENEGQKIAEDLEKRIQVISEKIKEISKHSTGLVEEYIVKLETRIKEILKTNIVDEARLAQEVVIYSDKCSVEEELTRLNSHIEQFTNIIKKPEAIGKRLDFLVQEMNRETNTIGSKANNLHITNLVIDVKTELENVREQIQNIE